jgi:hypothetical protein
MLTAIDVIAAMINNPVKAKIRFGSAATAVTVGDILVPLVVLY